MIKKEVVLNPDIAVDTTEDEISLNERLIRAAIDKRTQIAEAYKALGIDINPPPPHPAPPTTRRRP